jgi:hypothetical protein
MGGWVRRMLRTCWLVWLVWTCHVTEVEVGFGVSGARTGDDLSEEGCLWTLIVREAAW